MKNSTCSSTILVFIFFTVFIIFIAKKKKNYFLFKLKNVLKKYEFFWYYLEWVLFFTLSSSNHLHKVQVSTLFSLYGKIKLIIRTENCLIGIRFFLFGTIYTKYKFLPFFPLILCYRKIKLIT